MRFILFLATISLLSACGSPTGGPSSESTVVAGGPETGDNNVVVYSIDSLPPDPGRSNNETVSGIDSDGDGVRDDIQRWVVQEYQGREEALLPAIQTARAYSYIFTHYVPGIESTVDLAIDKYSRASKCMKGSVGIAVSHATQRDLEVLFLNTYERVQRWTEFNRDASGKGGGTRVGEDLLAYCDDR